MDYLLLSIALLLLFLGGWGVSQFLSPTLRPVSFVERCVLALLLGPTVLSLATFCWGLLLPGVAVRWPLTILCLLLGGIGWRHSAKTSVPTNPPVTWQPILLTLSVVQLGVLSIVSHLRVLGWDGLFNFEGKARIAFLQGGIIPWQFFTDPTRLWQHPNYPLLLPLTESWLYLWLGRPDQAMLKIIGPLFFATALGLLYLGQRMSGVRARRVLVAPLALFGIPLLWLGDGSASSGYADFPLAVFYLAAVIYLVEFWRTGATASLWLAGILAAATCWLKQEGLILWMSVMSLAACKFLVTRQWRFGLKHWSLAALPGIVILAGWRIFMRVIAQPGTEEFMPVTPGNLRDNLWRIPEIAHGVVSEMLTLRHWGVFWVLIAAALVWLLWRRSLREWLPLALAVLLPITAYASVYIFTLFTGHLESSFPRLLLHVTPTATLLLALAFEPASVDPPSPAT
ncbi:MAG: hypothetical protein U0X75_03830 [Acidobacteriota bacterium]